MVDAAKFTEVGPERRRPAMRGRPGLAPDSINGRLRAGATLLLPTPPGRANGYSGHSATLRRAGYRLHQRKDPDGIVVWAEKIEETP